MIMLSSIALSRIQSEVRMLRQSPPTGIWATPSSETQLQEIEASIAGPQGSVYEGGIFKLKISIPARYGWIDIEKPSNVPLRGGWCLGSSWVYKMNVYI